MELQHFRIALQIMAGHPEVLNEFKQKVKSECESDSTTAEVVKKYEYFRGPPA
jgi:hypothetical protein